MRLLILFILFAFSVFNLSANQLREYEQVQNLESTLEQRISNELSVKLSGEPFTVFVKIITKKIVNSGNSVIENYNNDDQIMLPGLFEETNDRENTFGENSTKSTFIDHIEIYLTLDDKIDSFSVELAEDIIYRKAELVENRGDKVIIQKIDLSNKKTELTSKTQLVQDFKIALKNYEQKIADLQRDNRNIRKYLAGELSSLESKLDRRLDLLKEAYINQLNLVKGESGTSDNIISRKLAQIENDYKKDVDDLIKETQNKIENKLELSEKEYYYWLLFFLAVLILVSILVYIFILNTNKKQKEEISQKHLSLSNLVDSLKNELNETKKSMSDFDSGTISHKNMTHDLASLFVARKNGIKNFILNSLNSNDGHNKIGLLASQVGMRNLESLFSSDEVDKIDEIREIISGYKLPSSEFLADSIESLRKEIIEKTDSIYQSKNKFNPFEFIKTLNDDQIMHLLSDEEIGIQAFIISQIDHLQSAKVLEKLSIDDKVAITLELATMTPPSGQAYHSLSEKLSQKLSKMPSINKYIVEGSKELMDKILMMTPDEQESMLNKLKTQNMRLWEKLRNNYLIFNDLKTLNDETLKAIIYAVPMKDLAISIKGSSEELIQKVVSQFNERMQVSFDNEIRELEINSISITDDLIREKRAELIQLATKISHERGELI